METTNEILIRRLLPPDAAPPEACLTDEDMLKQLNARSVAQDVASATPGSRSRWLKMATEDVDRAGDRLVLGGMSTANFEKNPQFLWQHGHSGALVSTIGRVRKLVTIGNALYALVEYTDGETNPLAEQVYRMDEAGLLPANSIGFRPLEWEENAYGGYDFLSWELIECSKVELPMNPNAVDDGAPVSARAAARAVGRTVAREYTLEETARWLRGPVPEP